MDFESHFFLRPRSRRRTSPARVLFIPPRTPTCGFPSGLAKTVC